MFEENSYTPRWSGCLCQIHLYESEDNFQELPDNPKNREGKRRREREKEGERDRDTVQEQ